MLLPEFPPAVVAVLSAAAFLAGALNAIAGGGSLITLPALVWAGIPVLSANATGTTALLSGYFSSSWALRHELGKGLSLGVGELALVSVVGGAIGAWLLSITSPESFRRIVPWLILLATFAFAFGGTFIARMRALRTARAAVAAEGVTAAAASAPASVPAPVPVPAPAPVPARSRWVAWAGLLAVSIYGGYFNGGLGVMLLALFVLLGERDIHAMNGGKNLVSAFLTTIAVVLYAAAGLVDWPAALLMMIASTIGGYVGGRVGRRLPMPLVRAIVIIVGVVTALAFLLPG